MSRRPARPALAALCCVALLGLAGAPAPTSAADEAEVERLALEVERVEAIRAVKRLQAAYAQYAQFGLWGEMAALFADEGRVTYGAEEARRREPVHRYFLRAFGAGREGLPPGGLHTRMIVRPIVTLSSDGRTAKGRWSELAMTGRYGGEARWSGGIYENAYVRERGVWKIAHLRYYPMFAGAYETGWFDLEADLKIVPYHFTPDQVGAPVPPLPSDFRIAARASGGADPAARVAELERRAAAMVEEDAVLNLQHAFGFYLDRKMWDDVADLFTPDGALEIADLGVYDGAKSIRRGLERNGPPGLRTGEVNEHVLFDTVVDLDPNGVEAHARGLQFIQTGATATGQASIGVAVVQNRFVKQDGVWRIREARTFPLMRTDYYQGWGRSRIAEPAPAAPLAPDRPSPSAAAVAGGTAVPEFFYPHPVTGRSIAYLPGMTVVAGDDLTPAVAATPRAATRSDLAARLAEVRRQLAVAGAYDAVENLSGAFGTWNDDLQWDKSSALFAEQGRRGKVSVGFYVGPSRIRRAEIMSRGLPPSPRTSSELHFRMQPVIHVAPDGRSAKLRSRYLHLRTTRTVAGTFAAGSYSNDAAVLENGVWRFSNAAIDDGYIESASYKDGWARVGARGPGAAGQPLTATARLLREFPPDIPIEAMPYRQQGFVPGRLVRWPEIKPMWFHYVNPVSGRYPPYYCADESTCDAEMAAAVRGAF